MPRFAIFSDLHLHPWSAFSKPAVTGVNDRLLDGGEIVQEIQKIAYEKNCSAALFTGDFFHTQKIDIETYHIAAMVLLNWKIPLVMIPGNHDEASKFAQYHSLAAFESEAITVFDRFGGGPVEIEGVKISGLPFVQDKSRLLESIQGIPEWDILLLHTGFAGASAGFEYIADQKDYLLPSEIEMKGALAIAGHFHDPQIIRLNKPIEKVEWALTLNQYDPLILIPGSPLQHTFSDVGSPRGMWIYDTDGPSLQFIQLKSSSFVKMKERAVRENLNLLKNNFVEVLVEGKASPDLEEILRTNARGYRIVLQAQEKDPARRTEIGLETKQGDVLKLYHQKHPSKLNSKKLLGVGNELLRKAEQE